MTLLPLAVLPPHAIALPQGGQVVAGQVGATFNGARLTLDQASQAAIMNWRSFDIAPHEVVRILQSGPDAALLARVTGGNPTELLGQLQADGKLFLINPRGILVGQGAVIDTAAFLASTLDVADADFLKGGPLAFKGDSAAGVVNLGRITAREGSVLLLAHTVKNAGEITAASGTAGLGAGTEVHLAPEDTSAFVVKFNLPDTAVATGLENSGVIAAARVQLEAAGGSIYDLAVNHSGAIHATGVEHLPDGRILLTASGGNVLVSGSVTARTSDGAGGEILVGGDYQGKNTAVANATNTQITRTATLDASASSATGDGGRVIVWADRATRYAGSLAARGGAEGGDGGFAEVSGKRTLGFHGTADLLAPAGRSGTLLLDPETITIVAGGGATPAGLADRQWFSSEDPGDQTVGADIITGLLTTGTGRVFLQAGEALTVNAPIVVADGGVANTNLSLQAPTITINESISLVSSAGSVLDLFYGSGTGTTLTTAAGATIAASQIRLHGSPIVALNGPVETGELVYQRLGGPATSFTATNPANAIARFILNTDGADPYPVGFTGNVAVHSDTPMQAAVMIGSANNVTLSSAGDLTLVDDSMGESVITASGVTRLASTGGVLINQAGADLLAGTGRRLLYSSDTTGAFTLGGLTGYTQFDGVGYPDDPQGAVTLVLYSAAGGGPTLTLTITANDFIRFYGEADPTFTASYAGGTAADLTMLPTFSIQGGPAVNVGAYIIVPSGAASSTHSLSYVNGTFRIDPATLTYVATAASRLYGDANPALGGSVTGFVNGDTLASATTGTLTFTSPATAASNTGNWAINGGGLTANHGNYVFEDALANFSALTVSKAPLTATFADLSRTYGAANPEFTPTFTGFRNGDTAAVLTGYAWGSPATAASPVGTYEIGASGGGGVQNYAITTIPGTLTVTPAPLIFRVSDVIAVYGDEIPSPGFTVSGLVGLDTASVLNGISFGSTFFNNTPAGTYALNYAGTGTAQNYVVAQVIPGTLTVTPAPLVFRVNDITSAYGNVIPSPGFTLTGLRGLDTPAVLNGVNFGGAFSSATAVGTYALNYASTGTAQNYVVAQVIPGTLNVTRRLLTITADSLTSIAGVVPPFGHSLSGWAPGLVGFSVGYETFRRSVVNGVTTLTSVSLSNASPAGDYVIRPVVTSGGLPDAAYDFKLVDGTLTLNPVPVDPGKVIINATIPIGIQNQFEEGQEKLSQVFKEYEENRDINRIVVGGGYKLGQSMSQEMIPAVLKWLAAYGSVEFLIVKYGLDQLLTPEQLTWCVTLNEANKQTSSRLERDPQLFANDSDARTALAVLLAVNMLTDVRTQGGEYSPPKEILPMTTRVSVLLDQLRNQKLRDLTKVDAGADNVAALYLGVARRDPAEDRLINLVQNPTDGGLTNLGDTRADAQELFIVMQQMLSETYQRF